VALSAETRCRASITSSGPGGWCHRLRAGSPSAYPRAEYLLSANTRTDRPGAALPDLAQRDRVYQVTAVLPTPEVVPRDSLDALGAAAVMSATQGRSRGQKVVSAPDRQSRS